MTPTELREKCELSRSQGMKDVILVVPGRATGHKKRLFGKYGPLGEILQPRGNDTVAAFPIDKVIKYLDDHE